MKNNCYRTADKLQENQIKSIAHSLPRDNYEILSHTIKNSKTQKVIPSGSFFNQYARLAYDLAKV